MTNAVSASAGQGEQGPQRSVRCHVAQAASARAPTPTRLSSNAKSNILALVDIGCHIIVYFWAFSTMPNNGPQSGIRKQRKSRGRGLRTNTGCLICKRRHVKCDEIRSPSDFEQISVISACRICTFTWYGVISDLIEGGAPELV
ncbi:unnamed protein product [Aspergillus oryzae RIB40]|uniref:DNA, SC009 n=2 Tax=Aspergillus oryzae TaxID=5062 RepID=Q2UUG5_ASPOR|nr:unnamed protein product [Aspergillus oryzae RIB40]EIT72504.1 hypothetical protein Ao3042_00986 [Aspergillus oryzae 3.042]KDE83964.1 hypothetical protein AO1008_10524 [Aspergillus oryzae 100-8]BAE54800.1 unnamed protein product [Aspergillus oryzae RIB40]|eukprot:EIT72504.1 hypothetical protein Ao3042_00986 [Aspergillus oryzae 3.042]